MTSSPLSADRSALVLADLLPGTRVRDAIRGASVGYLVGFVAAAAIVGWCARQGWVATWRGAAAAGHSTAARTLTFEGFRPSGIGRG